MREQLIVAERLGLVRDGLVAILAQARGGEARPVLGAATMAEALDLMSQGPDGVLLLDLALLDDGGGQPDGLAAGLQAVRARFPAWLVVALPERETRDGVLRCLAAGAHGVVAKTAAAAELVRAVEVVVQGGVHVSALLAAPDVPIGPFGAGFSSSIDRRAVERPLIEKLPVEKLTERQRDVLRLMAEGRSTKDIARTLDLAVSTIKVHLAAVYRTVGARNRVEALCRAGLLPSDPLTS